MMGFGHEILAPLLRATALLAVSAVLVQGLIWWLRPSSLRIQRAGWFLVLVQGVVLFHLPVRLAWLETRVPQAPASAAAGFSGMPDEAPPDTALPPPRPAAQPPATDSPAIDLTRAPVPAEPAEAFPWALLATAVWLAGVVYLPLWAGVAYVRFLRRLRSAHPAPETWVSQWQTLLAAEGIRRPIPLALMEGVGPAMCWTPRGYRVFVPQQTWAELSASQRAAVLRHELAHLRRGDLWLTLLTRLLALPHWFNPFARWAVYRFAECAEWACDQAAAGARRAGTADYAKALLRLGAADLPSRSCVTGVRGGSLFVRIRRLISAQLSEDSLMKKATILSAAAVLVALNVVRVELVAKEPAASQEQGLTYTGKVTDKTTGEPIAGATVVVRRSILSSWEERQLQETKHQTDAEGNYTFTIPPEQVAERYLYIQLDVVHPDYAPQKGFGYALGMMRKNEKLGGRPFFEHVQLQPAEQITGTVVRPDGTPAAELKVLAYSKADPRDLSDYGSFDDTKTDEKGVFRLNLVKGGKAVFWLLPKDYVPSTHAIDKKRGDLGRFVLEEGITIRGRVLDVEGKPIRAVFVNAALEKGAAKKDIGMPVADAIRRSAITDEQGSFVMGPLPPGEYRLMPGDHPRDSLVEDRTRRPLPAVFFPQMLTLTEGRPTETVEIRAVPHVTIEAQYVDSSGKPCRGHSVDLVGRRDGGFYFSQGRPDRQGKISFKAPKGLEKAQLNLVTNEHGVLRYRLSKDAPLKHARRVELGTLDKDVTGFIIVRYEAPILVVKAIGEDGKTIEGFKPRIEYPEGTIQRDQGARWISGIEGDVNFEKQEDGRWRSSQLLPDQPFTLTLEAEGYQPKSDKLTLAEGAIREVEWQLTKR